MIHLGTVMFLFYTPDLLHLKGAERERKADFSMNLEKALTWFYLVPFTTMNPF